MAIVDKQTDQYGQMWGYDDAQNQWVTLDAESEQGSFAGNVLRGAGRGFQEVGQGISELMRPGDAGLRQEGERLAAEQEAAARSAPWGEFLGNMAPDIAAGVGVGLATGGASLPVMLGSEAALGGALGGVRPGSFEERVERAAIGSAAGIAGGIVGGPAISGINRALSVGGDILGRTTSRVAGAVEAGADRVTAARGVAGEGAGGAAGGRGSRSVGAAETPEAALGDEFAMESRALARDEATGGEIDSVYEAANRRAAEDMGYRSPMGAGTRGMSSSRLVAAANEFNPVRSTLEQSIKNDNQRLMSQKLAQALGLPDFEQRTSIQLADLADAEATIGRTFQDVESRLPNIDSESYAKALRGISQKKGAFGRTQGQKIVDQARENAEAHGGFYDAEEIMTDRSYLNSEMSRFYAQGDTSNGDVVRQALDKLDKLITTTVERRGQQELTERWADARTKWQILTMAKRPGAISAQGEVNPVSLRNSFKRDRSKGGFGLDGPERGTAARDVWTLLNVAAADSTGVPATGARNLIRTYGQGVGRAAGGALGLSVLGANPFGG